MVRAGRRKHRRQDFRSRRRSRRAWFRQLGRAVQEHSTRTKAKVRAPRCANQPRDPVTSAWSKFLQRDGIGDPSHRNGRLFRYRFRVPYPIYADLLHQLQHLPQFRDRVDALGRPSAPLNLKLLAALRVLGRGECFDTCEELCDIASVTLNNFFHDFTAWLSSKPVFETHVHMPTDDEGVDYVLAQYNALGFPGCVGSIDCCHVHWDRCPAAVSNVHTGKETYPTRSFEVAVGAK